MEGKIISRLDFRRTKKGTPLIVLFGVIVASGRVTAQAAFVAERVRRPVVMRSDNLNVRVSPIKWTGFSAEKTILDQLHIEVTQ